MIVLSPVRNEDDNYRGGASGRGHANYVFAQVLAREDDADAVPIFIEEHASTANN